MRDEPERTDKILNVAGGYEFTPTPDYTSLKPPSPELTRALFLAYTDLDYDLVVLAPSEETLLRDAGVDIPDNWVTAGPRPGMVELEKAGLRIGVVIFPFLDSPVKSLPGMLVRQVADKALRLRERCDLVIGVSLWGGMPEKRFMTQAGPAVDVLLGSGPGPGLAGGLYAGRRTFWTRPAGRGKSLNAVGLAAMPSHAEDWKWVREENVHLLYRPLDESVAPDPAMESLFDSFAEKKTTRPFGPPRNRTEDACVPISGTPSPSTRCTAAATISCSWTTGA